MNDLIHEIHRIRQELLDECGNDLDRLMAMIQQAELQHPERIVKPRRKPGPARPTRNPRAR